MTRRNIKVLVADRALGLAGLRAVGHDYLVFTDELHTILYLPPYKGHSVRHEKKKKKKKNAVRLWSFLRLAGQS